MKHLPQWLLSIAVALSALGPTRSALVARGTPGQGTRSPQREVLVIYATGREAQISIFGDRELPRIFQRGLGGALDYYSEYLDTGRFPDPQYLSALRDFLRRKYDGRRLDVVIAMDASVLEFLAQNRDELFTGTPVVFLSTTPVVQPPANSTGIIAEVDYARTLDLAAELQPDIKEVYVISGAADSDRAAEKRARKQFLRFEPRLAFTYLSGLPTEELEQRLATLPNHSIVYYLIVYQDGTGEHFHPLDYLDRLAAVSNRPIYSWVDSTINRGVVGGNMQRQQSRVEAIGDLALRVLRGEPADSIPIYARDVNVGQVDWRQLRRWNISEARVPAGTLILFREPGVWDKYKVYIVGVAALLLAQSALIGGLLVQAARRRRAEEQLRRNQSELRSSYERIRDLGARLLGAQDAERSRIARELHDDVSQQAALLAIDLQLLGDVVGSTHDKAGQLAREAFERSERISRSVHDLSHRLHPAKLRLIGLVGSLSSLQGEFSQADVAVTFSHQNVPAELPQDLTLCIFRVVQEALQNAVKHGAARNVSMNLTGSQEGLTLVIVDDGVGFDVDSVSGNGLGLLSMSERLEPLGGKLKIYSKRGAGTRLEVTVPFRAAPATVARTA